MSSDPWNFAVDQSWKHLVGLDAAGSTAHTCLAVPIESQTHWADSEVRLSLPSVLRQLDTAPHR